MNLKSTSKPFNALAFGAILAYCLAFMGIAYYFVHPFTDRMGIIERSAVIATFTLLGRLSLDVVVPFFRKVRSSLRRG